MNELNCMRVASMLVEQLPQFVGSPRHMAVMNEPNNVMQDCVKHG
jgi:hypothetical protein